MATKVVSSNPFHSEVYLIQQFENKRKRNDERGDYRRSTPCEKNYNGYYDKNYRERRGNLHNMRGRRGRYRMAVGFTTLCAICAYDL
jgi:hypothetical protein